ncbi:MAG: hypothetical protein SGPRY_005092, partial [Prymnesium sp.]
VTLMGVGWLLALGWLRVARGVHEEYLSDVYPLYDESSLPACHRPSAREARKLCKSMLLPLARSMGAEMSPSCPLHEWSDRLLEQEKKKLAYSMTNWKCEICGKSFRSEHYIDLHLDRKHMHMLPANATTCLGDFCDILRCPSWVTTMRAQMKEDPSSCQESVLEGRRHFCRHLMHECFHADESIVRAPSYNCFFRATPCRDDPISRLYS